MPIAIGTVKIKNLPEAACFKTFEEFLLALQQYLVIEIPDTITNVVVGHTEPSSSQRDSVWFKFNHAGDFIGIYLFSGGAWELQIPTGLVPTGPYQVLTSDASEELSWVTLSGSSLFASNALGQPYWLATGANGSFLASNAGVPTWFPPGVEGDILSGGALGVPLWVSYDPITWTPSPVSSPGTGVFTVNNASYVKIGKVVTCDINLLFSQATAGADFITINLPFPSATNNTIGCLSSSDGGFSIAGSVLVLTASSVVANIGPAYPIGSVWPIAAGATNVLKGTFTYLAE